MNRNILLLAALFIVSVGRTQTTSDALRYSTFDVSGTARSMGVGGGLGALGADFSVISTNPAGLAMFRTSEFTLSPSTYTATTRSDFQGSGSPVNKESKTRFNFSNIGYVTSARSTAPVRSKWKTVNIAIGMNQLANYNREFFFSGSTEGSYTDRFVELAYDENGIPLLPDNLDQFEAGLAFETGAIYDIDFDYENGVQQWTNDFQLVRGTEVYKEQRVNTRGSINELNFALAGNFNERLMIGASVGLPFVNFSEEKVYQEDDPNDEVPIFIQNTFREDLTTSGVGVNFKLGMIYRMNQTVRIGAAVHTPTSYNLTDNFSTELEYVFDQGFGPESFVGESPDGAFEYKLRSPWRYIGSAGFIIKKQGFLTAEVEYLNYSGANFNLTANSSDPGDAAYEEELNGRINNEFSSAINIKFGGEYVYKIFRFRAGYAIYGTPYADDTNMNNALSFGLGFRQEKFFLDMAFRRLTIDEGYIPYRLSDAGNEQFIDNSTNNDRIIVTLGFKF